jgi:hypothetical protein
MAAFAPLGSHVMWHSTNTPFMYPYIASQRVCCNSCDFIPILSRSTYISENCNKLECYLKIPLTQDTYMNICVCIYKLYLDNSPNSDILIKHYNLNLDNILKGIISSNNIDLIKNISCASLVTIDHLKYIKSFEALEIVMEKIMLLDWNIIFENLLKIFKKKMIKLITDKYPILYKSMYNYIVNSDQLKLVLSLIDLISVNDEQAIYTIMEVTKDYNIYKYLCNKTRTINKNKLIFATSNDCIDIIKFILLNVDKIDLITINTCLNLCINRDKVILFILLYSKYNAELDELFIINLVYCKAYNIFKYCYSIKPNILTDNVKNIIKLNNNKDFLIYL